MVRIRIATAKDSEEIIRLINRFADEEIMIPVDQDFLFEHINSYLVAVEGPRLIGTVFLRPYNASLAEVRSLAVDPDFQGRGVGKRLVRKLIRKARKLHIKRLFTLTYIPEFFRKEKFFDADRNKFPEKIWIDCEQCPRKNDCREVSLVLELT